MDPHVAVQWSTATDSETATQCFFTLYVVTFPDHIIFSTLYTITLFTIAAHIANNGLSRLKRKLNRRLAAVARLLSRLVRIHW